MMDSLSNLPAPSAGSSSKKNEENSGSETESEQSGSESDSSTNPTFEKEAASPYDSLVCEKRLYATQTLGFPDGWTAWPQSNGRYDIRNPAGQKFKSKKSAYASIGLVINAKSPDAKGAKAKTAQSPKKGTPAKKQIPFSQKIASSATKQTSKSNSKATSVMKKKPSSSTKHISVQSGLSHKKPKSGAELFVDSSGDEDNVFQKMMVASRKQQQHTGKIAGGPVAISSESPRKKLKSTMTSLLAKSSSIEPSRTSSLASVSSGLESGSSSESGSGESDSSGPEDTDSSGSDESGSESETETDSERDQAALFHKKAEEEKCQSDTTFNHNHTISNTSSTINLSKPATSTMPLTMPLPNTKSITKTPSSSASIPRKTKPASSYIEMVTEALRTLKDRNGSSVPAISKYMFAHFKKLEGKNPNSVKTNLQGAIKSGVKSGRFTKVRASYKINSAWVKKEKASIKAKDAERKKRQKENELQRKLQQQEIQKKKLESERERKKLLHEQQEQANAQLLSDQKMKEGEKRREMNEEKQVKLEEKKLKLEEKRAAEIQRRERKAEEARQAKILVDRIRRRKFPMDDLELISKDLELNLPTPPEGVTERPDLPRSFRYGSTALDGRVITELVQIYHFLFGDVGFLTGKNPEFTLKHLACAFSEIDNGNAARAKCIPPILVHLFTTLLWALLVPNDLNEGEGHNPENDGSHDLCIRPQGDEEVLIKRRLKLDFQKLSEGLSPSSWSDVLRHYIDLMDRVAVEKYPRGFLEQEDEDSGSEDSGSEDDSLDGVSLQGLDSGEYHGYLGHPNGVLFRAHQRLASMDAWNLNAEEIAVLLRVLCDDLLSSRKYLADKIAQRGDELHELQKEKKTAETHYRKIKFAYEGPKQPPRKRKQTQDVNIGSSEGISTADKGTHASSNEGSFEKCIGAFAIEDDKVVKMEDGLSSNPVNENGNNPIQKHVHVPTVSKKEYEAAEKNRDKAVADYEKGLRELVSRTEPIGHDRDHNAVYIFLNDTSYVLIECKATQITDGLEPEHASSPQSVWHTIETKSLFNSYMTSLDTRGVRELALHSALSSLNVRRGLHDDIKEINDDKAIDKHMKELEKRLAQAREAVHFEELSGRRSGRLASLNQVELSKVEQEMKIAQMTKDQTVHPAPLDYRSLTGLDIISDYDIQSQRDFLGGNIKGHYFKAGKPPKHIVGLEARKQGASCLWRDGGVFGILIAELQNLEIFCSTLQDWDRKDITRCAWLDQMKRALTEWKKSCRTIVGPPDHDLVKSDKKQEHHQGTTTNAIVQEPEINMKPGGTPCRQNGDERKVDSSRMKASRPEEGREEESQSSVVKYLDSLKKHLLDLEGRIYEFSGIGYASKCVEEGTENGSVVSSNSNADEINRETLKRPGWKKLIHSFHSISTSKSSQIREILIQAIANAKANGEHNIVGELRGALKQYRSGAASAAKAAALNVLKTHGGYDPPDGNDGEKNADDETTEFASLSQDDASISGDKLDEKDSLLSRDAAVLTGNLHGDDDAGREDWRDAVRNCKTAARFAALTHTFLHSAMEILPKLDEEQVTFLAAMKSWQKEAENNPEATFDDGRRRRSTRRESSSAKKTPPRPPPQEKFNSATELWINWYPTDEIVWAKVFDLPWWPSRLCKVKDKKISAMLSRLNRVVINHVGDERIFVVKRNDIREYSDERKEDMSKYDEGVVESLAESITMARRICRGHKRSVDTQKDEEEKKSYDTR